MFLPNHSGDHSAGIVNSTPTNDTDLVNKAYVDNIPLNVAVDLFSYNEASDIATYLTMKAEPSSNAEETVSDTVVKNTNDSLIGSFATELSYDAQAKINTLTEGVYNMHAHLYAGRNNRLKFYVNVYFRDVGGTETLIGTTDTTAYLTTVSSKYNFHFILTQDYPLTAGDRIVVKAYANNMSSVDTICYIQMEGTTATSG